MDFNYAQVLAQNPDLSFEEIDLLGRVQKHKQLLSEKIRHLKSKGLIEGKKPHYYISAFVAQTTGQKKFILEAKD